VFCWDEFILEFAILTSVGGLAYMHKIRFSVSNRYNIFDIDDPIATAAKQENS
jgi:hypothetical protein